MVHLFLAEGFEEIEAITPVDLLRRAGIEVTTVSVGGFAVHGAHGILVEADSLSERLPLDDETEGIILPGGLEGTQNLMQSEELNEIIKFCDENNRMIAAICAAPTILAEKGLLKNKKATCYPGFEDKMGDAIVVPDDVVVSDNIITAKAAGASFEFSAAIIEYLRNKDEASSVLGSIQWKKS
ncbi:MAG: DJ-1/PfpI family protein [Clostridiales bacterium]|jgi:4-methyl-5(b-hydroxyethyl)-thiazole monophosphate biosynthesis|nr:DJ-1/PfpI family protein [Clostridiales bacterium]